MYRTAVTIYTAQWSLYVPHSGHYMYRTVVAICTASLTFWIYTFCPHRVFMCCVWIWEQTAVSTALFWAITQWVVVIYYRRFGTTRCSHLHRLRFCRQVIPKRR